MVSRRSAKFAAMAGLAAIGGFIVSTYAQQRPAMAQSAKNSSRRVIGSAHTYRNLVVFPVYDSGAKSSDTYVTLDEGLKSHAVTVKESKDGGTVNTLYVTNTGNKPLYLMAGEVVLGGQQDRTLANDTIVPPGKKGVPVTVFCVEHGRWSGRSEFGQSAPTVAALSIRASAMNGEFNAAKSRNTVAVGRERADVAESDIALNTAPANARIRSGRANAQPSQAARARANGDDEVQKAQQMVWDGVEAKNKKFKISNGTGTYRDALTMSGGDTQKSVPTYVRSLSGSLGSDPHLVGVVAAVNGKVIAADIFSDPALFRKLWPKLLRSYAADAVEQSPTAGQGTARTKILSTGEVTSFLARAKDEKSKEENLSSGGRTYRYNSSEASVYSLVPAGSASQTLKPLHESVLRK